MAQGNISPMRARATKARTAPPAAAEATPGGGWLTRGEAADYLRVHPATLDRMRVKGTVRGYRLGSRWRYKAADLDQAMVRAS